VNFNGWLSRAGEGVAMPYRTTELELASFLKARGHQLLGTDSHLRLVGFTFDGSASADADAYFMGSSVSARELFQAHRHLRALIQQLRQHLNQKIRDERVNEFETRE
jgi:hypothetical protein